MAIHLNLSTTSSLPSNPSFLKHKHNVKFNHPPSSSSLINNKICAQSQGTDAGVSEDDSSLGMLSMNFDVLIILVQISVVMVYGLIVEMSDFYC